MPLEAFTLPIEAASAATQACSLALARGHYDDALQQGQQALLLWETLGDSERVCEQLEMLALACSELDVNDQALALARRSFDLARQAALPARLNQALALMGTLHGRLGDWDTGESLLMHALSRARDRHDLRSALSAQNGLTALLVDAHEHHVEQGDSERADAAAARLLRHARQLLPLSVALSDPHQRTVLRSNVAAALLANGLGAEALPLLQDCCDIAEANGLQVVACKALQRLAQLHALRGDTALAQATLQSLLHRLQAPEHRLARTDVLHSLQRLATRFGSAQQAAIWQRQLARVQARRAEASEALREALQANAESLRDALQAIDSEWFDRQQLRTD